MTSSNLVPIPELYVSSDSAAKLKLEAADLPSWDLTQRQLCDLELLMNGGFSPLEGLPRPRPTTTASVDDMRLADGTLWPIPITLDVTEAFADKLEPGQDIALRDREGVILAIMSVTDKLDARQASRGQGRLRRRRHRASRRCNYLHDQAGPVYLGGPITGIQPPVHYDFRVRRNTPDELRDLLPQARLAPVVAFQTRNPLHRAHQELTFRAAQRGAGEPADPPGRRHDQARRRRPLHPRALLRGGARPAIPQQTTTLSLLPLAMRMAGPREAVWHAHHPQEPRLHPLHRRPRPRRPGQRQRGQAVLRPLRRPGAVRASTRTRSASRWCRSSRWSTSQDQAQYVPRDEVEAGADASSTSPAPSCAAACRRGCEIPDWFTFPEVVEELRRTHPPRHQPGLHRLLHRPLRLGQVDDRQRAAGQAAWRWAAGR